MGIPVSMTVQLAAASDTAVAASQSPGAGAIVLNGSAVAGGVAVLDAQRRVIVTSGGNDSGITFTIIGTNSSGTPISQTITGANAGIATSTLDFKTVTSVTHTGSVAGTLKVGTNGVGASPWKAANTHISPVNISFAMSVSGTINYTVQVTYDIDPCGIINNTPVTPAKAYDVTTLATQTADAEGAVDTPISAWRVVINSGTGSVTAHVIEAGIRG